MSARAWEAADFSRVRLCLAGGEALGSALLDRWRERTGLELIDNFGTTESCNSFLASRPGDVRPDCVGRIVQGYEARIVDGEGREVPSGEPGMLMIKGDSICACYWNEHELTKEAIVGAWLRTGDTFVRDEAGYFYFRGRTDDMLKVGGMWVSPSEIETVLDGHEQVTESAVVGVADSDGIVRPEAFVVLAGSGDEQQLERVLRHYVRQRLGGNKTPRAFHFVATLPEPAGRHPRRSENTPTYPASPA
jgi:acyl-coenzyme A synthetase/AMP-(fatty) acid ligase